MSESIALVTRRLYHAKRSMPAERCLRRTVRRTGKPSRQRPTCQRHPCRHPCQECRFTRAVNYGVNRQARRRQMMTRASFVRPEEGRKRRRPEQGIRLNGAIARLTLSFFRPSLVRWELASARMFDENFFIGRSSATSEIYGVQY